jgi:hypothetical protein
MVRKCARLKEDFIVLMMLFGYMALGFGERIAAKIFKESRSNVLCFMLCKLLLVFTVINKLENLVLGKLDNVRNRTLFQGQGS